MRGRKKINNFVAAQKESYPQEKGKVRLFFEDEASFGRISEPKYCWCAKDVRPVIPKQRVREYRNVFGAVEPETGDSFFLIEEKEKPPKGKPGRRKKYARKKPAKKKQKGTKSRQMNDFMQRLVDKYPEDRIVLVCDNAWWHKSQYIKIPDRMTLVFIPPYTPEMNPIEQIWREIRTLLGNTFFRSIDELIIQLRTEIENLSPETIRSITQRDWIMKSIKLKCN